MRIPVVSCFQCCRSSPIHMTIWRGEPDYTSPMELVRLQQGLSTTSRCKKGFDSAKRFIDFQSSNTQFRLQHEGPCRLWCRTPRQPPKNTFNKRSKKLRIFNTHQTNS